MPQLIELLQTKIATLKNQGYNLRTAELVVSSIFKEIEAGTVIWAELGVNKTEIDRLFFEILKTEFIEMYSVYLKKEIDLDDLSYHFTLIDQAIRRSQLSFSELKPFDAQAYFQFRSYFNVTSTEEESQ